MQLIGQTLKHKTFGKGVVTDLADNIVTISFSQGEKKFIYPEAFVHFLTSNDELMQNEINSMLNRKSQAEQAWKQHAQKEQERVQKISNFKIVANSQAAFDIKSENKDQVFSSWTVSTGQYLSGFSKGLPRIADRLKLNSVCLLTECPKEVPEKDRRIIGAFMMKDDFVGNLCKDGIIEGHKSYRIVLKEDETLLFWDYFDKANQLQRWGNAAFKYFSNDGTQRVLFDIKKLLRDYDRRKIADEFYQYYCKINRLEDYETENYESKVTEKK